MGYLILIVIMEIFQIIIGAKSKTVNRRTFNHRMSREEVRFPGDKGTERRVHADSGNMSVMIDLNGRRLKILEQTRKITVDTEGVKVSQQLDLTVGEWWFPSEKGLREERAGAGENPPRLFLLKSNNSP